ncbi:hypothetical protein N7504_008120 [Penicillium tannophilum]|nr:hypothetical protein N7504_008120 [Penicillium tannophilum]
MAKAQGTDDLFAIFVHAGAGYHSRENEVKHLKVCELAVEAGMAFLRHGGTAVSAVEMALMVLEDAPITNAGLGSNLNEQGIVECDASIVDHFGRSGAVGAVPSVKNPIQLARRIYDKACKSPGMSRVPPNLLCGEGATNFAWNNNVVVVPNDVLISPLAGQRFKNWTFDIAEWERENPKDEMEIQAEYLRRAKPLIPADFPSIQKHIDAARRLDIQERPFRVMEAQAKDLDGPEPKIQSDGTPSTYGDNGSAESSSGVPLPDKDAYTANPRSDKDDFITDTVGAIAIDKYGNIAAGSSSGGIGMKHPGRIGPAALIGIGTHVIPVDPTDPTECAVAVVASGTGEHIASTFAASTCATRVYYSHRKAREGLFDQVNEEEAIAAMLENEFTGHPAVKNSDIDASLGLLAVKKTNEGIALFFAHNTGSFAIGSLSSRDEKAQCVMSRNPSHAPVAQGGLMIRPKNKSSGSKKRKHQGPQRRPYSPHPENTDKSCLGLDLSAAVRSTQDP